jgi:16S rRNA (guanine527-N7)-methyltransferase
MQELFKQYDINLTQEQETKFKDFLQIFIETNAQINLSAIRDEAGIIEKHFIDSLILTKFCSIE